MKGLDVSIYADRAYDWFQMEEIRKGLEDGLDTTIYASVEIPYDKMQQIRLGLCDGNYVERSLNKVKQNSQEVFYAMAYSNAEKINPMCSVSAKENVLQK